MNVKVLLTKQTYLFMKIKMWDLQGRESALRQLSDESEQWDILIVGGGITGAGIFREASRHDLKVLLIEQKDFAWGTSSRSSKLIHGGLRYLLQGDLKLTWHAAKEKIFLQKKFPGLIKPLTFLFPIYQKKNPKKWMLLAGLSFYDFLAGQKNHGFWTKEKVIHEIPRIDQEGLLGAGQFSEATTNDARLVLTLLKEATHENALPINYMALKSYDSKNSAVIQDAITGQEFPIRCKMLVNAAGVWSDQVLKSEFQHLRPLRGSHLFFPGEKFPLNLALTILHPDDGRPIFAYPWEGCTLVGTTDLDFKDELMHEPAITQKEVHYLLKGIKKMCPSLNLGEEDILSTYTGLRPIIKSGRNKKPSQERRDTAIWVEKGILNVIGGKLTTFRITARQVLKEVKQFIPNFNLLPPEKFLEPVPFIEPDFRTIVRTEAVVHLDDLLLRRTHLGFTEPRGGLGLMDQIKTVCREDLRWSESRWKVEEAAYHSLRRQYYRIPGKADE